MFFFGIPLVPTLLLAWVFNSMDRIMIRSMVGYNELGIYAAAYKVVSAISIAQSCFTTFWSPIAYRWYDEGRKKNSFEIVSKLVTCAMTIICLVALYLKQLLPLLLGSAYKDTIRIVPFLLLYPVLYTISESTAVGIGFSRKNQYNLYASFIACVVNIVLNFILISQWGALGAAVATGIANIVFFWARTVFTRKVWYKYSLKDYIFVMSIILINCIAHTISINTGAFYLTTLSIIIVLVYFRSMICNSVKALKREYKNTNN